MRESEPIAGYFGNGAGASVMVNVFSMACINALLDNRMVFRLCMLEIISVMMHTNAL